MATIHTLANRHLPGEEYTIERLEFLDGDTRTRAKHSVGWGPGMYQTYILRSDWGRIDIEYYEHDSRLLTRSFWYELRERWI